VGNIISEPKRQANMALCENDIFSSFVKADFDYAATTRRVSASIGRENNFSSRVANVGVASPRSGQSGGGGSHYYWGATATSDDQYLPSELRVAQPFFKRACPWTHAQPRRILPHRNMRPVPQDVREGFASIYGAFGGFFWAGSALEILATVPSFCRRCPCRRLKEIETKIATY
jgi:hypothetical protein